MSGLLEGVNEPPSFSYDGSVKGHCDHVTSGVVVDVFYTRAGQSQRTALHLLVGATITYVRATDGENTRCLHSRKFQL